MRARLQRATNFDVSVAAHPDARIPFSTETALWDEAARLIGDDEFGLLAAERLGPGVFDVLDYAVRTAPMLRVALERLTRYHRLSISRTPRRIRWRNTSAASASCHAVRPL
jgi:hypothetical protein